MLLQFSILHSQFFILHSSFFIFHFFPFRGKNFGKGRQNELLFARTRAIIFKSAAIAGKSTFSLVPLSVLRKFFSCGVRSGKKAAERGETEDLWQLLP